MCVKRTAAEYYLSKSRYSPSRSILLPKQQEALVPVPVPVLAEGRQPMVGFGSTAPRFNGMLLGEKLIIFHSGQTSNFIG